MFADYNFLHSIDILKGLLQKEVSRGDETFSGYNKPKRTPKHATKSHAVLARDKGKTKLIRFGQKGVKVRRRSRILKPRKLDVSPSRQDTPKISNEVRCRLPTGQIKSNGKLI